MESKSASTIIRISVCICTRRRQDGLKKLLESFENLVIPPETDVTIIIVENDTECLSREMIMKHTETSRYKIKYFLETNQGIVYARNRSVKESGNCDFCCFTDDDQIVSPDWLKELMRCQTGFDADGVAGPTIPLFNKVVPAYMDAFHQPNTFPYGTIVGHAFTGCLLLRKKSLDLLSGPFDIRLNFSGGEDSHLTKKISKLGGTIRFNPDAIAYEFIRDDRTTIRYIIKKTLRTSNTLLAIRSLEEKDFRKLFIIPKLTLRFCLGVLIILPYLFFGKTNRMKGLIKIVNAIGGFAYIFGKTSRFYR